MLMHFDVGCLDFQVKYCSENNKRLIHFSTCEVYGKTIGSFLPKDSPLRQVRLHFLFSFVLLTHMLLRKKKKPVLCYKFGHFPSVVCVVLIFDFVQ